MKKWITLVIILSIIFIVGLNKDNIIQYVLNEYTYKNATITQTSNTYKKDLDIAFVKETNDFFPNNKQDLLNIFYTSLNNGVDTFMYYCTDKYTDCMKESEKLAQDNNLLSNINNFVHPYNSYKQLSFTFNSYGKVEVTVEKQYTKKEIATIENKVNEIYNLLDKTQSISSQIKSIHDYLISNSSYDQDKANAIVDGTLTKTGSFKSETAYGVLLQGQGICSGFSDTMELFLTKMKVPSYKVASSTHIWNLVYLDKQWYHLDLTWDNPIVNGAGKLLLHDFFLIKNDELQKIDTGHHQYDKNIYKEALS